MDNNREGMPGGGNNNFRGGSGLTDNMFSGMAGVSLLI